jgi:DNA-binding SARP family transcriptional activator
VRGGVPVASGAWQSRKAQSLLKLLVVRRGVPTTREALIEVLWPDESPRVTGNRLSVALSTLRAVLDPGRSLPSDHFVVADRRCVGLRPERVSVDADEFMNQARAGLARHREGRAEAVTSLEAAAAVYGGEFLAEDIYEDWAVSAREQYRDVYVRVLRALAEHSSAAAAVDWLRRILEQDRYDEHAHLELVSALQAAARHGAAAHAYAVYAQRMGEIGVEPRPFPRPAFNVRHARPNVRRPSSAIGSANRIRANSTVRPNP